MDLTLEQLEEEQKREKRKKIIKASLKAATALIAIILVFPYTFVEYLTYKHSSEFSELYKSAEAIDDVCLVKVYECNKTYARVYYVETGRKSGSFAYFGREWSSQAWVLEKWETLWEKGSDTYKLFWPYY